MPREIVNANEMQRRVEDAVDRFFEDYKRRASVAHKTYPLDRAIGSWLDDLQAFLDVDEFKKLGVIPLLKESVTQAKTEEALGDSPE